MNMLNLHRSVSELLSSVDFCVFFVPSDPMSEFEGQMKSEESNIYDQIMLSETFYVFIV